MERRRFSQTMASEWQTAFVVSHKLPRCALLTAVKNYNRSLENCKTFSSRPRPRPRPNVQDQDQDFHFCPRGASRPKPWSRGLHHCQKSNSRSPTFSLRGLDFHLLHQKSRSQGGHPAHQICLPQLQ